MTTHAPAIASLPQRAAAIEAALQAHGLDAKAGIELGVHNAEDVWLPERGARVVAKAWVDDAFRPRLLATGKAAVHGFHLASDRNPFAVHVT